MGKGRLEAFSDGVVAIVITIMVLDLKVPQGVRLDDLRPLAPVFLGYVLSFVYVGIYWNNHHHLLQVCTQVSATVLWANLHLLFWISLLPFATGWMGEHRDAAMPTALYGLVLLMAALAFRLLQRAIAGAGGPASLLVLAIGDDRKGRVSLLLYAAAIACAVSWPWVAQVLHVAIALIWLVPDRRIERVIASTREARR
jgi:uncharacterized membrane protein